MVASFDGLQFVITGGVGGIGLACACARELLAGGAEVLLVDIDAARLDAATAELDAGKRVNKSHCSRLASPQEAAAALNAAARPIHGLIHMAGVFEPDPFEPDDHAVYDRALAANLTNDAELTVDGGFTRNLMGLVSRTAT